MPLPGSPATWPPPNYSNPEVVGHYLEPILIFLMVCTGLVVPVRLYCRYNVLRCVSWDDYLIVPAVITAFGTSICSIFTVRYGFGKHMWDIRTEDFIIAQQYTYALQLLFTLSIGLTKVSILCFYLRFSTIHSFQTAIYATMAFIICWMITFLGIVVFQCSPVWAFWDRRPGTKCIDHHDQLLVVHGALNFFGDVVVLFLPLPVVLKLHLPRKQKISLLSMFLLGTTVCVCGLLRILDVDKVAKTFDWSWISYNLWLYTAWEVHIAIVCACIPALKPLIQRHFSPRLSRIFKDNSGIKPEGQGNNHALDNSLYLDPRIRPLGRLTVSDVERPDPNMASTPGPKSDDNRNGEQIENAVADDDNIAAVIRQAVV